MLHIDSCVNIPSLYSLPLFLIDKEQKSFLSLLFRVYRNSTLSASDIWVRTSSCNTSISSLVNDRSIDR